ncbi:hypothetical protein J1605_006382 [Eschrichtius robustus]|uniref:PH domain-containing protein n=1 Tax=Eschrichtius robustus TaxID=9764 RepID=A0AB34H0W9_ESCRO|nr:hypothetical protein J1605_006382 [Eschrichtius robustus]
MTSSVAPKGKWYRSSSAFGFVINPSRSSTFSGILGSSGEKLYHTCLCCRQKPLELRCEEEQDGKEWMEAIHQASYADILIEREVLMQKYIHLVQIVETEKIAANQLRHQLEDQDTEIERLKSEVFPS